MPFLAKQAELGMIFVWVESQFLRHWALECTPTDRQRPANWLEIG